LRRIAYLAKKKKEERQINDLEELLTGELITVPIFFSKSYDDSTPREEKSEAALRELEFADLIFFDPDNGLSFQDTEARKSEKHIYLDELSKCWEARKSLLVYHHWGRPPGGIEAHMEEIGSYLRCNLKGSKLFMYSLRRGSGRTYFLVVHPDHAGLMAGANKEIVRTIEPLTHTAKEWRHKAAPCSADHNWQIS
jgi:hypothetical protein